MNAPPRPRSTVAGLFLSCAIGALSAGAAPAGNEPGDLWEVTSQMSMEGMPMAMPLNTQKVCTPKTWTKPPGENPDKTCETYEFKNSPTTTTWKMRCGGPPAMTGEGEITRTSPEAYKGTMTMSLGDEGSMTMKLTGRRVGDCDSGEAKKQSAALVAQAEKTVREATSQADDAKAAACKSAAATMDLPSMKPYASICADAQLKSMFCARLETEEGFQQVCERREGDGTSLAEAASYCGKDVEALRKPICVEALNKESLELLGKCCPVQSKDLALRECAGRNYTAMVGTKYGGFCVSYARGVAAARQ